MEIALETAADQLGINSSIFALVSVSRSKDKQTHKTMRMRMKNILKESNLHQIQEKRKNTQKMFVAFVLEQSHQLS